MMQGGSYQTLSFTAEATGWSGRFRLESIPPIASCCYPLVCLFYENSAGWAVIGHVYTENTAFPLDIKLVSFRTFIHSYNSARILRENHVRRVLGTASCTSARCYTWTRD